MDDVHVRRLSLQLLQQLEHVEVGAEVFLVQEKEDRISLELSQGQV